MSVRLAEQQRRFLDAILDGTPCTDAKPDDAPAFYRANMHATHAGALRATYPVIARLVGDAFFDECARRYAMQHPSSSGDLHRFGARMGDFLEAYGPAASLPYAPDVSRLEWAVHESTHAADDAPFDFAALARVPEAAHERLRARLSRCVRRLSSRHPIVALWEANQPANDGTPSPREGPDHALVWRQAGAVRVQNLDAAAVRMMHALANGASIGETAERMGADAAALPALLARWIAAGIVIALEPPA